MCQTRAKYIITHQVTSNNIVITVSKHVRITARCKRSDCTFCLCFIILCYKENAPCPLQDSRVVLTCLNLSGVSNSDRMISMSTPPGAGRGRSSSIECRWKINQVCCDFNSCCASTSKCNCVACACFSSFTSFYFKRSKWIEVNAVHLCIEAIFNSNMYSVYFV